MSPARSPRPVLDPAIVASFKRRRITDALAAQCVSEGYRATTIDKLSRRAGVSRSTVYEHFENRDHIFLTLVDGAVAELLERTESACEEARAVTEDPLQAGLHAVLDWVAERPAHAWVLMVEAFGATPESMRRYLAAIAEFTALFSAVAPSEIPRPKAIEESLVGGVASLLSGLIRAGEAERAPELLPEVSIFLRGPFLEV
ncbi:MAG TPA: TetR/AcrR family transcriptional regulator [Solirubrobacterales bacterium]|nr:TetR/AcrR family transcriptional regulator [Solirubrobacterales bacterium]